MTKLSRRLLFAVACCAWIVSHDAGAQEWTRFRGPNGSGVSDAKTVPTQWTDEDYNWKTELPGEGLSSPVLWGDKLFVTAADSDEVRESLVCLNAKTGEITWSRAISFESYKKHKNNTFASNTPVVDADRVYVLFQTKSGSPLTAYDHDGKQLWQIDFGPYLHGQGGAVSPIVHGDMVIVANDHAQGSFLIAVDRATGKTIWKIPREGNRACYSTPCIFQPADREPEIIFTHCYEGVTGVIAKTGVTNWTLDPFGRFKQRAVGSPIIAGDLIIATSGFTTAEKNVVVLRTDALDGATTAKEIYRVSKLAPHIPTPLVYRDRLFLWTDTGIVSAYELKTGEELWKGRVGGNFYGSPVCVNGNLYCCDRDGVVSVVSAVEDDFELIATNKLGGPSRATPAVSDGVMYLRSDAHVVSLGGKASE